MGRLLITASLLAGLLSITACNSKKINRSSSSSQSVSSSSSEASSSSSSSQASSLATTLLINEVVTKSNDPTYLAGNDWIELYNNGPEPVSLDDYALADSSGLPQTLPQQTVAPGAYVIIAAVDSEDLNPPEPSVPFKLASSDSVVLFLDNQIIHELSWSDGDADEGEGYGIVEGTAQTTEPTPGAANVPAPPVEQPSGNSDLKLSEIVAGSTDDTFLAGNDWIELYNSGNSTIDLSEYAVADQSSNVIPLPSVMLPPADYFVIAAVDADDLDPPQPNVPFKLAGQDSVLLYQNGTLVDRFDWVEGQAPDGAGFGRVEDSLATTTPTPGSNNIALTEPTPTADSDIKINEIVAKSSDATFMSGNDWFELHNTGSSNVSLGNYFIADSNSELISLPNVVLAPGGFLVIAAVDKDDTDPPTPSVGFKLGSADSLSLYSGSDLVDFVAWVDGDAPEGRSFGLYNDNLTQLTPTPAQANQP